MLALLSEKTNINEKKIIVNKKNVIFTVTQFCSVVEIVHLKSEVLLNNPSIHLTYFLKVLTESSEYK